MTSTTSPPRIELQGITKVYPAVIANDDVSLKVMPGEIHAVLGENGAGKSTLMKAIYGVIKADKGHINWNGEQVDIKSPAQARKLGIGMVFQHFSLFETLSVVENVVLALEGKPALADVAKEITQVSEHYGLPVDPHSMIHALSVGERQRVEIIRCLLQKPKLLIMDEPTSVLTPQAVRKLFETLRQLASEGCSILYISHKLDEIKELCHTATILRGGKVTGSFIPSEETPSSMARMMIGLDLPEYQYRDTQASDEVRLNIHNLSVKQDNPFGTSLQNINLSVNAGEIVGIAGISGNGQQELLYALSGEQPLKAKQKNTIQICGSDAAHLVPNQRQQLGMSFVPEERLGRGAVPNMSLQQNTLLTASSQGMLKRGLINFKKAKQYTEHCIKTYDVRCGGAQAKAKSLSGGNLQKFIVGREVLQAPKLLIISQPTWGVDVGAAMFIRQSLLDLRDAGTAILVLSEELDELFEISDRIAVIAEGKLSPSKHKQETDIEEIGIWMSGLWPETEQEAEHAA